MAMVKKLSLLLILCATSSTAFTDTSHLSYEEQLLKGETWGFFSGAILGGAAGGPPGAGIVRGNYSADVYLLLGAPSWSYLLSLFCVDFIRC